MYCNSICLSGLRKVYPYYFKFESYAKKRWMNRRIIDIFMDEFGLSESTLVRNLSLKRNTTSLNRIGDFHLS